MSKSRVVGSTVALCVTLPIWFYLIYAILVRVNASDLMWFLFWVYMPTSILVRGLADYSVKP